MSDLHHAGDHVDRPPGPGVPPSGDGLDPLLRRWHAENAERAAAGRDRLLASLRELQTQRPGAPVVVRRLTFARLAPLAAAAVIALTVVPLLLISNKTSPIATARAGVVLAPDGGRLEAFDSAGDALGPCILKHTDVRATVCGPFARVTLTQQYHNRHTSNIEAVYTLPLSRSAAVVGLSMTVGDRVIIGEVKERSRARADYDAARASGRTAGLVAQERPNIFTQSVANIEPGADIDVTISYVEQVESRGGDYEFTFPTTVGPRYALGSDAADGGSPAPASALGDTGFSIRPGVNLLAPARISFTRNDERLDPAALAASIAGAPGIAEPATATGSPIAEFQAEYPDGEREAGTLYAGGIGEVGGRWFFLRPPARGERLAESAQRNTEAGGIAAAPTRPETRSGHDLSISVTIDTGGPGLVDVESPAHAVTRQDIRLRPDGMPSRTKVTLADKAAIANRDFVLRWRQAAPGVVDSVFTARTVQGDFFAVVLQPPNRVENAAAVPRELVFALDTSGPMRGPTLDTAKAVVRGLIGSMRPQDTLNAVTFGGDARTLWPSPKPITDANRDAALSFFDEGEGAGGTERLTALQSALRSSGDDAAALEPISPAELGALPADGREVAVRIDDGDLDSSGLTTASVLTDGRIFLEASAEPPVVARVEKMKLPRTYLRRAAEHLGDGTKLALIVRGRWTTEPDKEPARTLVAESTVLADEAPVRPVRIVFLLTDGHAGNAHVVADTIRQSRGGARVFPVGIGDSADRATLEVMARAGGGEAEFVPIVPSPDPAPGAIADDAGARTLATAIERLKRRTRTPVLTHLSAELSPGLDSADIEPSLGALPDLFESRPITLVGRLSHAAEGAITIRGQTVAGPWERTIPIRFNDRPSDGGGQASPELGDSVIPNLWARARIDRLLAGGPDAFGPGGTPADVRARVAQLGEAFGIVSPFTSLVAVDHRRMTIDGRAVLVPIPVDLPESTAWDGFFAPDIAQRAAADAVRLQLRERKEDADGLTKFMGNVSAAKDEAAFGREGGERRGRGAGRNGDRKNEAGGGSAASEATSRVAPAAEAPPPPAPAPAGAVGAAPAPKVSKPEPAAKTRQSEEAQTQPPAALSENKAPPPPPNATAKKSERARGASAGTPVAGDVEQQLWSLEAEAGAAPSDAERTDAALPADPVVQSLAAEAFYYRVEERINLAVSLGEPARDRLAVAAGANFIAMNAAKGQYAAAERAQTLFQNRYPDAPLLDAWDRLAAADSARASEAGAPTAPRADANSATPTADRIAKHGSGAEAAKSPGTTVPNPDAAALAARTKQAVERERTLLRRLDRRLYDLLPAPTVNGPTRPPARLPKEEASPTDKAAVPEPGSPPGEQNSPRVHAIALTGDRVIVSVLVETIDAPTLDALRSVGFRIDKQLAEARTIVGSIPIAGLEPLTLLPAVKRIEPATLPGPAGAGTEGISVR